MALYGLTRTTDASTEPVTLDEAKLHLRVTGDSEDDLIKRCITAARLYFEDMTNRSVIATTWMLKLDRLFVSNLPRTNFLYLPRSPLASVTSFYYIDTSGALTLWDPSNYDVDTTSEPGRIGLGYGKTWPNVRDQINAITITYVAGAANAASVPEGIKAAILCLTADLYYNRETLGEMGAKPSLPIERIVGQWKVGDPYCEFGGVE